jgi:hypothetical protein
MIKKNDTDDFLDFVKEFKNSLPTQLPQDLDLATKKLFLAYHPGAYFYIKFFLTYSLAGLISLLFCPQFGLNPMGVSEHFFHQLMSYGHFVCGAFCGAIFMGSGSFVAAFIFKKNEIQFINMKFLGKLTLISIFFIFGFMMINFFMSNDINSHPWSQSYNLSWALSGSIISYLILIFRQKTLFLTKP